MLYKHVTVYFDTGETMTFSSPSIDECVETVMELEFETNVVISEVHYH